MPRKTERIETYYRGVAKVTNPDGTVDQVVIKESRFLNTVKRYMRAYPDGTIEQRDLVGYYTPWTADPVLMERGKDTNK
jgi:hypothetical protein